MTKGVLKQKRGTSLIIVTCISAIFITFSLLLMASVYKLNASAVRIMTRQKCYQQALTLSDSIVKMVGKSNKASQAGTKSVYTFLDEFASSSHYGEDTDYIFTSNSVPSGYGTITLTLSKTSQVDLSKQTEYPNWQNDSVGDTTVNIDLTVTNDYSTAYTVRNKFIRHIPYNLVYKYKENSSLSSAKVIQHIKIDDETQGYFTDVDGNILRYQTADGTIGDIVTYADTISELSSTASEGCGSLLKDGSSITRTRTNSINISEPHWFSLIARG